MRKISIGENVKKLRESNNLKQSELADMVGVTRTMITQIERGTKVPSMLLGKDIAIALKCSILELYAD